MALPWCSIATPSSAPASDCDAEKTPFTNTSRRPALCGQSNRAARFADSAARPSATTKSFCANARSAILL
jgi:hypothetical protein